MNIKAPLNGPNPMRAVLLMALTILGLGLPTFRVCAAPPKDSALVSTGAELRFASNWSVAAKFDGEFAPNSTTYTGTGVVRYRW